MKIPKKYDLGGGKLANNDQKIAIDKMIEFVHSDIEEFVLIGKAGTGKTTIARQIMNYYKGLFMSNSNNVVAATISHAAKNVLRNALGYRTDVVTIAKLLGMKQMITDKGEIKFEPNPKTWKMSIPPIKYADLLIVDECSMISHGLLSLIREHKKEGTKIIFMGDWHQLPPIDHERDIDEDSPTFALKHKAILKQRMRQKDESPIVPLSDVYADNIDNLIENNTFDRTPLKQKFRVNNYNPISDEGVVFTDSIKDTINSLVESFKIAYETNNPNYVKAVAYRNKNPYGVSPYNIGSINTTIRKHLWNTKDQFVIGEIVVANNVFMRNRDVLIQNGDSFIVKKVGETEIAGIHCVSLTLVDSNGAYIYNIPVISTKGKDRYLKVIRYKTAQAKKNFRMWADMYKFKENFAEIAYGYAITSHKAQGSGYRNVYIFEDDIMGVGKITDKEKSQCMYTAITRATDKLVIFSKENKHNNG